MCNKIYYNIRQFSTSDAFKKPCTEDLRPERPMLYTFFSLNVKKRTYFGTVYVKIYFSLTKS